MRWLRKPAGELLCRSKDEEAEAEAEDEDEEEEEPILAAISLIPCDLCKIGAEELTLQVDSVIKDDESPEKY